MLALLASTVTATVKSRIYRGSDIILIDLCWEEERSWNQRENLSTSPNGNEIDKESPLSNDKYKLS